MATKKKSPAKKSPAKKRPATKKKKSRKRGRRRTMEAGASDLIKGLVGAWAMSQVIDSEPVAKLIKDPKVRYAVGAAGSVFLAVKFPKLAPFAIGAGIGSGYRAAVAYFPKLASPMLNGPRIGRMDQNAVNKLRRMVEESRRLRAMNGGNRGTLMGGNRGTLMGPSRSARGTRAGVIMGGGSNSLPSFM